MSTNVLLKVEELTKHFGGKEKIVAVDHVTFNLHAGEILGLLGPNGAGKSTTIQMLLGALTPSSGSIEYFGKCLQKHRSDIMRRVGYGNGYGRLPWNLTVRENLEVHGLLCGLTRAQRKERICHLLTHFGIWDKRNSLTGDLSAGQNTRVVLAKTFLGNPEVVLLDEPTASLDPDVCREVRAFIAEQQESKQTSIVYTSHNMAEVAELCDRIVFLKGGRVIATDTPESLARTISRPMVRLLSTTHSTLVIECLRERGMEANSDGAWVEFSMDCAELDQMLTEIRARSLNFQDIEIRKPSLEDYFLSVAGGNFHGLS